MRYLAICLFIFVLVECGKKAEEQNKAWEQLFNQNDAPVVLMFLAPDCPLCLTLVKDFHLLNEKYPSAAFYGIVSGQAYSMDEVEKFKTQTNFTIPLIFDKTYQIAKKLKPTRTPEFFLTSESGVIKYRGLMDNRIQDLGVFRKVISAFYLDSALSLYIIQKTQPNPKKTQAIGCTFEYY